ncbi:MAG: cyclic nucleotide-binding domain-containing protein [Oscillospiraceae bacterium]|nr:cyclic nucleotide-binding domain-containing protein [Oscillospiraceae bacterium]
MEVKTFRKGQVIFREGDPGDCMYDVYAGRIGVYVKYDTPEQKLLKEYYPDQYLGELGLLDHAPRSATAVALEDGTSVAAVTEEAFGEFFREKPAKVLMIMQQMSQNLRNRTNEYVDVCRSIHELSVKEGAK